MAKLEAHPQSWGMRYLFTCPGCECNHSFDVRTDGRRPSWTFDGDLESPTFAPSLLIGGTRPITDDEHAAIMRGERVEPERTVCHSFVQGGRIQFLGDCTHHLAGQTVDLPDRDEPTDA